jgi:hypothetical protein
VRVEALRIRNDQEPFPEDLDDDRALACCVARCPARQLDVLVALQGLHVLEVERGPDQLRVVVESAASPMGCPACGVVAVSHGRRDVVLVDAPSFGGPVRLIWRKRSGSCPEPACAVGTFTEQDPEVAAPRALLTVRACWWAVTQLRKEHASVFGLARRLGTSWRTVWRAVRPLVQAMDADPGGSRTSRPSAWMSTSGTT